MGARGGNKLIAFGFERILGVKNFRDLFLRRDAVQAVATEEHLRAGREVQFVSMDAELFGHADRHGEHVAHGMSLEALLFDAQAAADLIDPGLILGDEFQFVVFENVARGCRRRWRR